MRNSQPNHNMRAYIDMINEGTRGEYNPYKANEFTNAATNKAVDDLEAVDDLIIKNDRAFSDPLPDEPIDDLEAVDDLIIKNDRAFSDPLPGEPIGDLEDDIPLAVSKLALKNDPFDDLGYTPIDTNWSDVVSKEDAQRDDMSDSYKLAATITGKLMHDDGTYSHITANPDGGGEIDSSVRDAIIYTKKLKAKLAAKKADAAVAKAKKDKEEIEAATARFMASKEAKSQRDRFHKSHSVEHAVDSRAQFLAMRKEQEEERMMRREFLRKQQIENQKKRRAFYNSMYGRRPYR